MSSACGSRLEEITKHLLTQWEQTKDSWQDAKSHEFERQYLQELLANVDAAVTVIEKLDSLTTKIKKECE